MKRFSVRVTLETQSQVQSAALYIAAESIDRALAWEARVTLAMASLAEARGFAVDEPASAKYSLEVRRYVFERTYLIFYTVDETSGRVDVIEFRHGARQS